MNIIKPYARLVSFDSTTNEMIPIIPIVGKAALKKIEWCGRISHRSEDKQTEDSYLRFIKAVVIEHGDWSIVEHASATVDFYVDRGITHELVRHRLFSFTQESTRFVNYQKKMPPSFVKPEFKTQAEEYHWNYAIQEAEERYQFLIEKGESPQIARSVFPNALASRIIITGNLRNWRHFLIMRTTRESHPQMREVTIPLLAQFKEVFPILFDDIIPMDKQSEAIKKGR